MGALNVNMSAIWLTDSVEESHIRNDFYVCKDNIEVLLKKRLDNEYQDLIINN